MSNPNSLWRAAAFTLGICLIATSAATAQVVQQQVGGVSIDARGVVSNVRIDELNALRQHRLQAFQPVAGDLKGQALRKISLRRLEAAIAEQQKNGTPLADEIRYLAGIQRIQFVFVYPEQNDIVLAGPGEGWKLNEQGEVVGLTTNRPVMLLDDLLVALRAIEAARETGMSCSIDPTSEGLARVANLFKSVGAVAPNADIEPLLGQVEQALGPQRITITGVPETSHFAGVMLAADYRMKRLAMGFDEPPIAGLPSFVQMLKTSGRPSNLMPRWWLAANYEALVSDPDGLAWELPSSGVKAMTEDEVVAANGQRERTGKANPLAKKWADNMTAHYEELAKKDAVFGQLQNCMDLAVVAALISQHHLVEKCGWSMPLLVSAELPVDAYNAPQQVDTLANALNKSGKWIITASGGVAINPWEPLAKTATSPAPANARAKAKVAGDRWWWN